MQALDFWDQLSVHRKQIVLLVAIFMVSIDTHAQRFKWARENNPRYDERRITYGFMIGLHTSAYQVKYADQFITQNFDTVHSVMAPPRPGFSLGGLVNLRLYDVLDLRLMPKAGFYDHKLIYQYTNEQSQEQLVETALMEFPLLLKYKSLRRGNVRMYMVGGFTPSFELSGKNDVQSNTANLSVKRNNLSMEAGLGFDFYFPLFKFSQEIRFSRGLVDLIGSEPSVFRDPLKRINTNSVSVYFIFQ